MTDDEYTLWKSYTGEAEGINTFLMGLNQLKSSGVKLSYLSINILMLETLKEQLEFFENAKDVFPSLNRLHTTHTILRLAYHIYIQSQIFQGALLS